jgi:hypothetical protein
MLAGVQPSTRRSHNCVRPLWTQGFPDEDEESLLPQIMGVWKTVIIR